uniref:Ovule protein n=1 Tax=Romanomermis culicivorax TaxID=13658 RepID=A0A915JC46_ROMCU
MKKYLIATDFTVIQSKSIDTRNMIWYCESSRLVLRSPHLVPSCIQLNSLSKVWEVPTFGYRYFSALKVWDPYD